MTPRRVPVLPAAAVLGVGAVTPLGCDLGAIADSLSGPPDDTLVARVPEELLAEQRFSRRMRRADRFLKMAALAANSALDDACQHCDAIDLRKTGVIVASGFGPHSRMFRFLDGILDCGDTAALPTDFSHSVHNAAAAYITEILDTRGQSCSVTDFDFAFEQALLLGQCWLAEGVCSHVLLGGVEEVGQVMLDLAQRFLSESPPRGPIRLGEGAVFLTLGPTDETHPRISAADDRSAVDMLVVDEPEIFTAPPRDGQAAMAAGIVASFSAHFGHHGGGAIMQTLGALLSLKHRRPLGRLIRRDPRIVDSVATFRRGSDGDTATIVLTGPEHRDGPAT